MRATRWVLGSAALVAVPWIAAAVVPGQQRYVLHVLIFTVLYGALALSYDLVVGHVGSLSLAHPAFFGLGAYTLALLATEARWPFAFALPAGIALAAVVALAVGVPMFRLTEHSFAMGTLGFAIATQVVATNWVDFTHGPLCVTGIPKPHSGSPPSPRFTGWGSAPWPWSLSSIGGSPRSGSGGPSTPFGTTRPWPPPRRSIRSGTACSPS